MKKVLLLGDSVMFGAPPESKGYGYFMREKLAQKAEVYIPKENCGFTHYTLRNLHEWTEEMPSDFDVVHWNNGLWDIVRLFCDEPLVDIETYGKTLVRIYKRIKLLFPKAKIVFALTTRVVESKRIMIDKFSRENSDVIAYNEKAIEVLSPLGVEINDLYQVSQTINDDLFVDWVHYGDEGGKILADAVIKKCFGD